MLKNPTPHQISIRSSLLTSLAVILLVFSYFQWFSISLKPLYYLYFVTIVFIINYFIFKHYLSVYVQRKIKLIYNGVKLSDEIRRSSPQFHSETNNKLIVDLYNFPYTPQFSAQSPILTTGRYKAAIAYKQNDLLLQASKIKRKFFLTQ